MLLQIDRYVHAFIDNRESNLEAETLKLCKKSNEKRTTRSKLLHKD